ncbi:MAG: VIT domain-containing protein [Cyanobacteriota bacterium]|nr:VIT domain-containing protein [Cyanobacteriota bacterium]
MTTSTLADRKLGGLYANSDGKELAFPLKHTDVQAKIAGNLSRVEVKQIFENPLTQTLEAVYTFPLPDEAAVDEMEIKIGDRVIKGNIKKREEAQQIYQQAKQEGRTAGLLEQERDNIFTQSLANILPGEQIEVTIRYTDRLKFAGGNYEFIFPMVVGPRYIPGTPIESNTTGGSAPRPLTQNQDTDIVPDASQLNAPILPEGTRSRHDIDVTVEIDAGVAVQKVTSPSHKLQIEYLEEPPPVSLDKENGRENDSRKQNAKIIRIKLGGGDTISNKDLILRYQIAGNNTQTTVLTQTDERGSHFALYFIPATEYNSDEIIPKDVVFLVDTSGSQHGEPLIKCQELMRRFIEGLNPHDTFSILDFSNAVRRLSKKPLPNTTENRKKALNYINKLSARGGTEMLSGIRAAIDFPAPDGRVRTVMLLTDGYIGNEDQILAEVQQSLQRGNRLYSFGAGSSVNRFLLNRVAEVGRGLSYIIRHDEPTEEVTEKFFRQVNNPVLTNIEITWESEGEAPIFYPTKAPDLFAEQPLVLFGRFESRGELRGIRVSGTAAGGKGYEKTFDLKFDPNAGNPAVAQLWGRQRIKALTNEMFAYETKAGVEAVTETALTYQLLSKYTAFVAVSEEVRVNPEGEKVSVQVPVEMPEGVSHEGIFGAVEEERARGISMSMATQAQPMYRATVRGASPSLPRKRRSTSSEYYRERGGGSFDIDAMAMGDMGDAPAAPAGEAVFGGLGEDLELAQSVTVTSATGLDENAIASLNQHLQQLTPPAGLSGTLVLELSANIKGRITRILLDEVASTLKDATLLGLIRRAIASWKVPSLDRQSITLTLQVES